MFISMPIVVVRLIRGTAIVLTWYVPAEEVTPTVALMVPVVIAPAPVLDIVKKEEIYRIWIRRYCSKKCG